MIKEIVRDRDFLSQPSEPATADDAEIMQDLLDTYHSMDGDCACLAANQIGYNKAVVLVDINGKPMVMFNPKVARGMMSYVTTEGCMSLDDETEVKRYQIITVEYEELHEGKLVPRKRKLTEWVAEAAQHGIDHTKGILI